MVPYGLSCSVICSFFKVALKKVCFSKLKLGKDWHGSSEKWFGMQFCLKTSWGSNFWEHPCVLFIFILFHSSYFILSYFISFHFIYFFVSANPHTFILTAERDTKGFKFFSHAVLILVSNPKLACLVLGFRWYFVDELQTKND